MKTFALSAQGFTYWNENKTNFFFNTQSHFNFTLVHQKIFSDTNIHITNIKIKEWGSTIQLSFIMLQFANGKQN